MNDVWVRVDLISGESYIGYINTPYSYEDEDDLLFFLEEQSYMGLKLENVHRFVDKDGKFEIVPLDTKDSLYKSSMLIMNIDNILTIKFLKEDSKIVRALMKKYKKSYSPSKKAENILNFKFIRKEPV